MMDAYPQVAKTAPVRAVVQEQRERRAAVRQAAVLERAELVRPAEREDRYRRGLRRIMAAIISVQTGTNTSRPSESSTDACPLGARLTAPP